MVLRPGDVVAHRFVIERIAGEGGMGVVYRAMDRETGEPVALKLLQRQSADDVRRFAQEAQVLAQRPHPALVRLIRHGVTDEGQLYLAMEWLDGEDLSTRLARAGLPMEESLAIARRAAEGLAVAHARGIVHRDVKPANIFLPGGDPRAAKLLDFGIARIRGARHTATGIVLGTPGYMSPEQARATREVDPSADVFSLGCVLYECLAGRLAFDGDNVFAVLAKIVLEDPEPLSTVRPDIPPALEDLVSRMLAKNRADRPADGAAVLRELEGLDTVSDERPSAAVPKRSAVTGEQRLMSIVVLGSTVGPLDHTLPVSAALDREAPLREVAERYGARLDVLAGGTCLVTLSSSGQEHPTLASTPASDRVVLAAWCALALHRAAPDLPIALCTGVGDVSGRFPVGEVIDRAAHVLLGPGAGIPIDDVTAGLLDRRFQVTADTSPPRLLGERTVLDEPRTILGRATPFVGRDRELATIAALFEDCLDEPVAQVVLVTGPAGIGKSRLCRELLGRMAATEPHELWRAHGEPLSAGSPLATLGQALARAAGIRPADPLAVRRAAVRAFVSDRVEDDFDRIAAFIGEIVDAPFSDEAAPQLRAARADAVLMGDQTRRAFEDLLAAITRSQPLVLVVDDLQWSDPPSVGYIDSALRNLRDRPIFVLGLARPEVHDVFPRLWVDRRAQEVRLAELGRRACERLVREVAGDVPEERVAQILEAAEGNAFFLEELIRAQASGARGDTPGTVLAMVQARLEALPAEARRFLRAASVFGRRFWHGGVQELLGGRRAPEMAALGGLLESELVTSRGEGFAAEEEFGFCHALVQEAAYASLTPADRQTAHRVAGRWLEARGEKDPLVLAEHYERGADQPGAVRWYLAAAEAATEGTDLLGTVTCAHRGIACGATGVEKGGLRLLEARALNLLGRLTEVAEPAGEAMALLPEGSSPWLFAAAAHAVARAHLGDAEPVVQLAAILIALQPDASSHSAFVETASLAATQLVYVHAAAEAEALFQAIERTRERLGPGSAGAEARRLGALALRERAAGDMGGYLAIWRQAVELAEQAGDFRKSSLMRTNVGYALIELGRYAEAELVLRQVLAPSERFALATSVANCLSNLGMAVAWQDRLDEALEIERTAVATFQGIGNVRLHGGSRIYLAQILTLAGRPEEAEIEAREAVRLLEAAPLLRPHARAVLAESLLRQGRAHEAVEVAQATCDEIASVVTPEEGDALAHLVLAEALAAAGEPARARAAIATAHRRLLDRASRIGEPEYRESFLHTVPHHARTLALAASA